MLDTLEQYAAASQEKQNKIIHHLGRIHAAIGGIRQDVKELLKAEKTNSASTASVTADVKELQKAQNTHSTVMQLEELEELREEEASEKSRKKAELDQL